MEYKNGEYTYVLRFVSLQKLAAVGWAGWARPATADHPLVWLAWLAGAGLAGVGFRPAQASQKGPRTESNENQCLHELSFDKNSQSTLTHTRDLLKTQWLI